MNKIKKTAVLVMSALAFSCNSTTESTETKNEVAKYANQTLETIHNRKSVRSYSNKPVTQETIDELLKAAMAAPTGKNVQPWEFVVMNNKENMVKLSESLPYAKMLNTAQIAIVVCGNADPEKGGSNLWMLDCSAAAQNILLAAESLGLGAVWTAGYPYAERIEAISKTLNLPENIIPLTVIPIGYPDKDNTPKVKFNADKVKYNTWE